MVTSRWRMPTPTSRTFTTGTSTERLQMSAARHFAWTLAIALAALPVAAQLAAVPAAATASPANDWAVSSPADQGMDAAAMERLRQRLDSGALPGVRSVLVVRHDMLVFEYVRPGLQRDELHTINSATKSVVSALVGIALAQGAFSSLDQPVADFLPEARAAGVDPRVSEITVRHLLTMTSGFQWDERTRDACRGSRAGDCSRFDDAGDPTAFALRRPLAHAPGQVFNYDSPSVNLLALALARAVKMPLLAYAQQTLGRELGVKSLRWETDPQGHHLGGRGIQATARDLAKFGQLFLRGGAWQGRQVVPADYAAAATQRQVGGGWPWPAWAQYGYLWWVLPDRAGGPPSYAANGFGGQYVWVLPAHDAVVVIAANPFEPRDTSPIVVDFILPALGPR
jgi:CubicO group peptidase (beta-lactamase class C family)